MVVTAPLFRPVTDGSPQPVDIVVYQPPGYPHSGVFAEVAETLLYGFRALGYDANPQTNLLRFGVPIILFGAHMMTEADAQRLPSGIIIYNLEQIRAGAWASGAGYLELLRRHTVWDYSAGNVAAIQRATGHPDVHHVPIGWMPELSRIAPAPEQDIDVLFYGSVTRHRQPVLRALYESGLAMHSVFGVYGSERDALIARAKVVLNLHAEANWGFEIVRVSYLLANRKAVVCEVASPSDIDADLCDAVLGVPYDGLVDACIALVRDAAARAGLEQAGWAAFSARDEAGILYRALSAERPPVGAGIGRPGAAPA